MPDAPGLTPTGQWHEHDHDGTEPVVWLDVLDLPLIYHMETSYAIEGKPQAITQEAVERVYRRGGVVPYQGFSRSQADYPMIHYPWADVRQLLLDLAATQPEAEAVQVAYVNPETGRDCQQVLGFSALMLRPGERLELPARSTAMVFHQIEGVAQVQVEQQRFELGDADTCCVPGYSPITLQNPSASAPAFLFIADDAPLQKKLGVYEVRA